MYFSRTYHIGTSEPVNYDAQLWARPIANTYQEYIYSNGWKPTLSGGIYNSAMDGETYVYIVAVQNTRPVNPTIGLIWRNSDTGAVAQYFWGWRAVA